MWQKLCTDVKVAGGGSYLNVDSFYSVDPRPNPTEATLNFWLKILFEKSKKSPGLTHIEKAPAGGFRTSMVRLKEFCVCHTLYPPYF